MKKICGLSILFFGVLGLTLLSVNQAAYGSEINVQGRAYSATNCQYYSANLADIQISFKNKTLPWGTEIIVRYGFHDDFTGLNWQKISEEKAEAISPYTWAVNLKKIEVDARGSYFLGNIQFAFMIRLPDGEIFWDNGSSRSGMGYYEAPTPVRRCAPSSFEILPSSPKN